MKTQNKTRIAIAGIGGIGGYLGGKLALHYSNNPNIEIIFICRGKHYDAIKSNGLVLISNNQTYTCIPDLVSHDANEIGIIDVLLICTKSFSVTKILSDYANCINSDTIVITTQNTVNGFVTISPLLHNNSTLLEGSIYIASNIINPGKVHHLSGPSKLFFGTNGLESAKGIFIAKLLNNAGIDSAFNTSINTMLWRKFLFVSPAAIVTSLFKITIPEIASNDKALLLYKKLIEELILLAKAKNIEVDENTIKNNCQLLGNFAPQVKSSFQLDLENNKRTEINSLLYYVLAEAKTYGLKPINYIKAANDLTLEYELFY